MEVAVKSPEPVKVPDKQLLRYHQREEYKGEIESMQAMMPQLKSPQDRGEVSRRLKRLESSLATQSPVELPGSAKNQLLKEVKAIEERVLPGMLSQEEMRKNPAGAVGQHMKWERTHKRDILRWKNAMQMLDPTSDDPDLSNFERLRPVGAQDRVRLDAQIPGKMSYGSVPEENWNQAFEGKGPENTALKQAERVAAAKPKRELTEEQKQKMRENLAKARLARKSVQSVDEQDRPAQIVEGEVVVRQSEA